MTINRRGFLGVLATAIAAPMIVKATSIMPVKLMEPDFPELTFSIETTFVKARTRVLKAEYTMEFAQDLKAIHGMNAEDYLANLLRKEIDGEIVFSLRNDDTYARDWMGQWNS